NRTRATTNTAEDPAENELSRKVTRVKSDTEIVRRVGRIVCVVLRRPVRAAVGTVKRQAIEKTSRVRVRHGQAVEPLKPRAILQLHGIVTGLPIVDQHRDLCEVRNRSRVRGAQHSGRRQIAVRRPQLIDGMVMNKVDIESRSLVQLQSNTEGKV